MNGPPVLLYQHWAGGGASEIRSRMFAYLAFSAVPAVVIATVLGMFSGKVFGLALAGVPAVALGMLLGRYIRPA